MIIGNGVEPTPATDLPIKRFSSGFPTRCSYETQGEWKQTGDWYQRVTEGSCREAPKNANHQYGDAKKDSLRCRPCLAQVLDETPGPAIVRGA